MLTIQSIKSVFLYLSLGVFMMVAKPFLGFAVFAHTHSQVKLNIGVKSFTKRKQEFIEDGAYDVIAIAKKFADPIKEFFLHFAFFLSILFPAIFGIDKTNNNRFLNKLNLSLATGQDTYLVQRKLII